jgi:hypothetical protein
MGHRNMLGVKIYINENSRLGVLPGFFAHLFTLLFVLLMVMVLGPKLFDFSS